MKGHTFPVLPEGGPGTSEGALGQVVSAASPEKDTWVLSLPSQKTP